MTQSRVEKLDYKFIIFLREYSDEIARATIFLIFFWFGILKVFLVSPAGDLVVELLQITFLSFISPDTFMVMFGVFEVLLGVGVLFPKLGRIVFVLVILHLITTILPLILLPSATWQTYFVPTLVGQYIIKNAALLSIFLLLYARLRPMTTTHSIIGEEID